MKIFSAALQAHYQQAVTTLAELWRVTQTSGAVFGWTTSDLDVTIDGVLYRASQGLTPSSAHTTNDLSVDSMDVSCFMDVSTELEIAAGIWDEATIVHAEYDWNNPPVTLDDGSAHIKRTGTLGRIQRKNLVLTAEIRGLAEALQTRIGRQYSPICPWRHAIWNGTTYVASIECQADLEGLDFIADGSATAVGADATLSFEDSANPNPDDATPNTYYEAGGQVTMTSGANAGITREVLMWTSKTFTFLRPFPYPVEVGDTYRAVRGDAHDYPTCLALYLNVVNFGGFPHVPGQDSAYSTPTGI